MEKGREGKGGLASFQTGMYIGMFFRGGVGFCSDHGDLGWA